MSPVTDVFTQQVAESSALISSLGKAVSNDAGTETPPIVPGARIRCMKDGVKGTVEYALSLHTDPTH